ncbi:MAG: helix-turn-helix domain-containing protein [Solirubrobacterales bacterium]
MAYRELAPSSDVYSLVACRWMRQAAEDGSSDSILVLPDGCVDLLWREGELVLAGLDRTARPSPVSPGERILGLRLRPGVAGAVLGMPASEVLDVHLRLEELLGPSARELAERPGETEGDDEAFELLGETIGSRIEGGPDPLVLAARRLGFPGSRVDRLAESLGISERQLRRRFHQCVGYGPKTLDRVLRFRRLVAQSSPLAAGESDLARVAADLGYADQAHMTRDCLQLSGLTPVQLAELWTS